MKHLKKFNEDKDYDNKESNSEAPKNYMFFGNVKNMKNMLDELSKMDQSDVDKMLDEHDWASDHISVAAENIEHVYNFLKNK